MVRARLFGPAPVVSQPACSGGSVYLEVAASNSSTPATVNPPSHSRTYRSFSCARSASS